MRPFDETDLIAFHLQELSPRRHKALERALRTDPSLAKESAEVAATLQAFHGHTPLDLDRKLVERNWLALEPIIMKAPPTPAPRFPWRWNGLTVLAGGMTLAAISITVALRHGTPTNTLQREPSAHASSAGSQLRAPQTQPQQPLPSSAHAHPDEGERDVIRRVTRPARRLLFASKAQQQPAATILQPIQQQQVSSTATAGGARPAQAPTAPAVTSEPQNAVVTNAASAITTANQAANQAGTPGAGHHGMATHHHSSTDITLAMGGTFTPTRDGATIYNTQQAMGATKAVSAIASFHQQFRPLAGYRVTVSYTRPDFRYLNSTAGEQQIDGRVFELAATYVVQGPHHGRFTTAAEAGVGVMAILATVDSPATSSNTRVAGVLGFSTEMAVSKHLALRAAYRGQIFDGPDFRAVKTVYPLAVSNMLVSHEPSVGITYRFQRKQQ